MNRDASFSWELYHVLLLRPKAQEYRLTFGPGNVSEHFLFDEDEYLSETLCPKSTLLRVFKESHDSLTLFQPHVSAKNYDQMDIYVCTLGLLLTAPGHQTALNLHEKVFLEKLTNCKATEALAWLQDEILIIERLLTSNNNRLNKSSALWFLYRKLLVLAIDMNCKHLKSIETVISSGNRHFSNYYCWSTARWLYDVMYAAEKTHLLEATLKFCLENVRDASAWSALAHMVCQHTTKSDYNFSEYKRLRKLLKLQVNDSNKSPWIPLEIEWYVTKIKNTIDLVVAEEWPPYLCLLTLVNKLPESSRSRAFSSWHDSITSFEEKYGTIGLLRNNPVVPPNLVENALLSRTARHLGFKKLFLLKQSSDGDSSQLIV